MNAADAARLLDSCSEETRALARWVSFATRVSPRLLRAARLRYEPMLGPQVEAELWFGPLVETASRGSLAFHPEVARALRANLRTMHDGVRRAKALMERRARGRVPQLLRLEERLLWSAASGEPGDDVASLLGPVLKAMLEKPDRAGLSRWAAGICLRIPEIAHEPMAIVLESAARLSLHGAAGTVGERFVSQLEPAHKAVLDRFTSQTVRIGVRANGVTVTLNEPPLANDDVIEVPATVPKALFLQTQSTGARAPSVLALPVRKTAPPTALQPASVSHEATMPFTLGSVIGDRYTVRSLTATLESLVSSFGSSVVEILDPSGGRLGIGVLAASRTIVTTTSVLGRLGGRAREFRVRFPLSGPAELIAALIPLNASEPEPAADRYAALRLSQPAPHGATPARRSVQGAADAPVLVRGEDAHEISRGWAAFHWTEPNALTPSRSAIGDLTGFSGSPVIDSNDGTVHGLCVSHGTALRCVTWTVLDVIAGEQHVFDVDIFISYAKIDDVAFVAGEPGWVAAFADILNVRLAQRVGRRLTIWFDRKEVLGAESLSAQIERTLARTAIFIAIVSPAYVSSSLCAAELKTFVEHAAPTGGESTIEGVRQSRVLPVLKLPVDRDLLEPPLSDVAGISFFRTGRLGVPSELSATGTEEQRHEFYRAVDDLAYVITGMLESLRRDGDVEPGKNGAISSGLCVYLAMGGYDQRHFADRLRRELEQLGHAVLTADPSLDRYADRVRQMLRQSNVSVHMIGDNDGFVPEGSGRSIVEVQYELAGELADLRPDFTRLTWIPPHSGVTNSRLGAFIETLHNDPSALFSPFDDLLAAVRDALETPRPHVPETPPSRVTTIYVIYDRVDADAAKKIVDLLRFQGFQITQSLLEGDERELREDSLANIVSCDAVLIYWGASSEFWVQIKSRDLQKAFGHGRARPFLARGIVLGDPKTRSKQDFGSRDHVVIQAFGDIQAADIASFGELIRRGEKDLGR